MCRGRCFPSVRTLSDILTTCFANETPVREKNANEASEGGVRVLMLRVSISVRALPVSGQVSLFHVSELKWLLNFILSKLDCLGGVLGLAQTSEPLHLLRSKEPERE